MVSPVANLPESVAVLGPSAAGLSGTLHLRCHLRHVNQTKIKNALVSAMLLDIILQIDKLVAPRVSSKFVTLRQPQLHNVIVLCKIETGFSV